MAFVVFMVVVLLERFKAFVKDEFVTAYKTEIERVFGKGSCHVLKVHKYGGKKVI